MSSAGAAASRKRPATAVLPELPAQRARVGDGPNEAATAEARSGCAAVAADGPSEAEAQRGCAAVVPDAACDEKKARGRFPGALSAVLQAEAGAYLDLPDLSRLRGTHRSFAALHDGADLWRLLYRPFAARRAADYAEDLGRFQQTPAGARATAQGPGALRRAHHRALRDQRCRAETPAPCEYFAAPTARFLCSSHFGELHGDARTAFFSAPAEADRLLRAAGVLRGCIAAPDHGAPPEVPRTPADQREFAEAVDTLALIGQPDVRTAQWLALVHAFFRGRRICHRAQAEALVYHAARALRETARGARFETRAIEERLWCAVARYSLVPQGRGCFSLHMETYVGLQVLIRRIDALLGRNNRSSIADKRAAAAQAAQAFVDEPLVPHWVEYFSSRPLVDFWDPTYRFNGETPGPLAR